MQDQPQSVPVKSKNGSFQLSTDDAHLATVLSNSTFNDVTPQDSQIGRASSEAAPVNLRQRSKALAAALLPDNTHALTPEQLADHLHESPFIDTESCMTPYEWVKFVVLLPWLLFRIVVAIPLLIVAWSSTALLVAGVPVNTPLAKWRKKVVSVYMWCDICHPIPGLTNHCRNASLHLVFGICSTYLTCFHRTSSLHRRPVITCEFQRQAHHVAFQVAWLPHLTPALQWHVQTCTITLDACSWNAPASG